ncbi:MAG: mannosyltransferase family protein [Actinocatenispora sp.]
MAVLDAELSTDEPGTGSHGAVRLRDGLVFAAAVFVAVWVGWALLSLVGVGLFPPGTPVGVVGLDAQPITPGWHNLVASGNHADALWFQRIAISGYRTDDSSAAFFPLYPMAVAVLALLPGVSPLVAATIVAQGSFFGVLVVFHALTAREFDATTARRAVRYLAIFPTAFFFLAPYTEAPFLLLVLLTFWYARGGRWWPALLFAALAALTRSVGIVLLPALLVEAVQYWRLLRVRAPILSSRTVLARSLPSLATVCGPVLGLAGYGLYWQWAHGDLMAPLEAQDTWQREPTVPIMTLWHAVRLAWTYQSYWLIDLLVVGLVLVAVLAGARLIPPGYLTYALASLLMPLSDPYPARPLLSMPRFVLVVFPAVWVVALAVRRWRLPDSLVTAAFVAGYGLLGLMFINSYSIF